MTDLPRGIEPPEPLEHSGDGPLAVPLEGLEEGHARKVQYRLPSGAVEEVVLARVEGALYAADTYCPHEGGRLAEGPLMEGRFYHCPLHLYRFDPKSGASA